MDAKLYVKFVLFKISFSLGVSFASHALAFWAMFESFTRIITFDLIF